MTGQVYDLDSWLAVPTDQRGKRNGTGDYDDILHWPMPYTPSVVGDGSVSFSGG